MPVSKKQILAEIKRTADGNNGVPLGIGRFEAESGIRRADWHAKYWARWGDALAEAGYEPNKLQGPRDREVVIEHFVELLRNFQRLPTFAEMRIAARQSPGLPAHNTFVKYLGRTPQERVATLRSFCTEHEGYSDVVDLLSEEGALTEEPATYDECAVGSLGFVYMIKSGRYYKIGRSNSSGRRECEIALQMPERAVKVHEIRTDDPVGIEAYWHQRFADRRKNGEWFELNHDDLAAFRRRKFM